MRRDEQIVEASWRYAKAYPRPFVDGAMWADNNPNWISVENELPKPNEFVVVYGKSDGYDFIEIDRMINNNKWEYMDEVSHWMPLPNPPKKGKYIMTKEEK